MDIKTLHKFYDFTGKVAAVTGGSGVLCAAICNTLSNVGAKIVIMDIDPDATSRLTTEINSKGGETIGILCDVLHKENIEMAAKKVIDTFGRVDILINGAGGNNPRATTNIGHTFFDLPADAMRWVLDLNLMGTIFSSQVFGKIMAEKKRGVILNISSMNAIRPLTRIPAYSAAKAGVSNFTRWLAVHMAQEYSTEIRVNAIAPGFFITEQNRYLLTNEETGKLTQRGQSILDHTPIGRFGNPEDLLGTVLWLVSPASSFITGVVVPVDGGFSAYSGI